MTGKGKENIPRVTLYYGDDEYVVSERARRRVSALCPPERQALGLETYDGAVSTAEQMAEVIRACREALLTPGFMGGDKLVFLRGAVFFTPSAAKFVAVKEALERLTAALKAGFPDGIHFLVTATEVDKRLAFYKACKQHGEVEPFMVPARTNQAEQQARRRAAELFRRAKLRVDGEALDMFVQRVGGGDTRQLVQEAQKLALYAGLGGTVDREAVELMTTPTAESAGWALAEAAAGGQLPKALETLRRLLAQQENPLGLLFAMEKRFRQLEVLRACLDRGWARLKGNSRWRELEWSVGEEVEELLGGLGSDDPRAMNPYAAMKLAEQAAGLSAQRLAWSRQRLVETHEQLLSSSMDAKAALEILLVRLSASPVPQ